MKYSRAAVLAVTLFAAGCCVALFGQEERRRDAARLPSAVTNTLHRLYPGVELRDVDDDGDGAERVYKLELRLAERGGDVTLRLLHDGSLVEIKDERDAGATPEAVSKSLARAFQKGRVTETRVVTRTVVTYEVEVQEGDRRRKVTLSPRGKILEVEKR